MIIEAKVPVNIALTGQIIQVDKDTENVSLSTPA